MNISANTRTVAARDLNDSFIGRTFAYESSEGIPVYGRIAFAEVGPTKVLITLDGVLHEGSSVVMTLAPQDELAFTHLAG
ncbi:hypothetical protein OG552_35330 [Streptomyces sp. NBC_01476]|uniref:hypothetical protein n=1 Tax=Streptomyces sp. NBC_01476 TaxID=2903881 RepID=UPI002E3189E8|nr:hypothetical protein [Streptomyces sp. NBC_01476]